MIRCRDMVQEVIAISGAYIVPLPLLLIRAFLYTTLKWGVSSSIPSQLLEIFI